MKIKKHLSAGLLMAGMLTLFSGCGKEDLISGGGVTSDGGSSRHLSLTASVQDFTDMETGTRASESGTTISFGNGDAIGVFGVKGGSLVCNNLRFTTSNGSTWSGPEIFHESGTTYFAYYPYESGMNGKTSLAAIQSDFESRLNSNPDQGNQANYMTYCKLLVSTSGSVSPSGDRLSFAFKHALAMVEVVLPDKLSGTMSANGGNFAVYSPSSITTSFSLGGSSSFYNISGKTYRRIVKPGTSQSFKATLCGRFDYTNSPTVSAGNYKKITLGNVSGTVQVGDFAYGKDGGTLSFFPGSTTTEAPDKDNCIGVVATIGQFGTHGTVLAKTETSASVSNNGYYTADNRSSVVSDYTPKAPSGSSWYLQGSSELCYLCSGSTSSGQGTSMKEKLDPYLQKAGGTAWSDSWHFTSENQKGNPQRPYCVTFANGNLSAIFSTYPIRLSFSF